MSDFSMSDLNATFSEDLIYDLEQTFSAAPTVPSQQPGRAPPDDRVRRRLEELDLMQFPVRAGGAFASFNSGGKGGSKYFKDILTE